MAIKLDEHSYCLSCNLDRYHYLKKCFESVGLKPPALFPGIVHRIGANGCTLGHLGIMTMARCLNHPYTVVYEDDAYPRPDVIDCYNDIIRELEDNKISWQVLVLGRNGEFSGYDGDPNLFWRRYPTDIARNRIHSRVRVVTPSTIEIPKNPNGSHAYIIKREAYNEWINILISNPFVDIALGANNWKYNRIIWTKELLFVQKQIDKKCMTKLNDKGDAYIYPYYYNRDCTGCCSIFKVPPKGFVDELVRMNNIST